MLLLRPRCLIISEETSQLHGYQGPILIRNSRVLYAAAASENFFIFGSYTTPGLSGVWDQNRVNSELYIAFWSVEPTDFKNVAVENIHWAFSL